MIFYYKKYRSFWTTARSDQKLRRKVAVIRCLYCWKRELLLCRDAKERKEYNRFTQLSSYFRNEQKVDDGWGWIRTRKILGLNLELEIESSFSELEWLTYIKANHISSLIRERLSLKENWNFRILKRISQERFKWDHLKIWIIINLRWKSKEHISK